MGEGLPPLLRRQVINTSPGRWPPAYLRAGESSYLNQSERFPCGWLSGPFVLTRLSRAKCLGRCGGRLRCLLTAACCDLCVIGGSPCPLSPSRSREATKAGGPRPRGEDHQKGLCFRAPSGVDIVGQTPASSLFFSCSSITLLTFRDENLHCPFITS